MNDETKRNKYRINDFSADKSVMTIRIFHSKVLCFLNRHKRPNAPNVRE